MTEKLAQQQANRGSILNTHRLEEHQLLLHSVVTEGIRQSRLSANQAHWSFSVAVAMTAASTIVGLAGAGLVLLGKASEGSVTAAAGLASGVYSHQVSKDASERQQQANQRLDQMLRELQGDKGD